MDNSVTRKTVEEVYLHAWKERCKGITIYREGTRDKEVLKKSANKDALQVSTKYNRPTSMYGGTHKIGTGHGNMYVTVNFDENGGNA